MPTPNPSPAPKTLSVETPKTPIESARNMGAIYRQALTRFMDSLDDAFTHAITLLLETHGHVIVCGIGKSGLFARKIAATLASTGTPAIFLHPAEALHGDLGKVRPNDSVIMISHSGETEEVIRLLPALNRLNVHIIAMTGDTASTLAQHADTVLNISVDKEACPLNLAPTTSGLMTLVMGDALAIALMERRGFQAEDFAATHPGGALGRRLLSTVAQVMVRENLPFVAENAVMREVIVTMTQARLGIALVGTPKNLKGIITDGDLRRALVAGVDINTAQAGDLMTEQALTIAPDTRMADAEQRMQEARVQCLVVIDGSGEVVGIVQIF